MTFEDRRSYHPAIQLQQNAFLFFFPSPEHSSIEDFLCGIFSLSESAAVLIESLGDTVKASLAAHISGSCKMLSFKFEKVPMQSEIIDNPCTKSIQGIKRIEL